MATRDTKFLLKRSNIPGKIPPSSALTEGEIALNTADAILYTSGSTQGQVLPIGWDRIHRTGDTMSGTLYVPTISASTYQNLPADIFVSGGTYSAGTATFTNTTGGTFDVSGFSKYFISTTIPTGTTINLGDRWFNLTDGNELVYIDDGSGEQWIEPNPGGQFLSNYLPLSGGTVSGGTNFLSGLTANIISASTYQNLPADIFVSGGTYSAGTATFTNTTGGTFNVTGFSTTTNYWQYTKGNYQTFHATAGLGGGAYTATIFTNVLTAFPLDVRQEVTIESFRYVNASGVAGSSVWGVYDSLTGSPNNLLFQSTAFSNAGSGVVNSYTLSSPYTLSPGLYWIAYLSSSSPAIRIMQVVNSAPNVVGESTGTSFNGAQSYVFRNLTYTATMPSPFGTISSPTGNAIQPPYVYFKIQ